MSLLSIDTNLSHSQLQYLVAERLRVAILEGQFKPGEWLRQERLAQELGVSQMPIREALKALAAEGLVEHVPYRGVRVVEFVEDDIEDLYAHRCFLESRAARSAAKNITRAELDELRELHHQMTENLAPSRLVEYRRLNRRFHQVIFSASRREYLTRTLTQLWSAFPNMLLSNFPSTAESPMTERDEVDIQEHGDLIQALESGNGELAERIMIQHIQNAKTLLIERLKTRK